MIFLMLIDSEEDKRKFQILYQKYWRLMYKVAYEVLNNRSDVEDVLHDSFEKVAKNMDMVGEIDAKETKNLMVVIAKHKAIDIYRKKKRRREKELNIEYAKTLYVKTVFGIEDEENIVTTAIQSLPDKYRDVMSLRFHNQYSIKEISRILNISENNVKQRILRGKSKLKEIIDSQKMQK